MPIDEVLQLTRVSVQAVGVVDEDRLDHARLDLLQHERVLRALLAAVGADVGIDVYNVFNSGDATAYDQAFTIGTTATQRFLYPTSIVAPRFGRFNLTLSF